MSPPGHSIHYTVNHEWYTWFAKIVAVGEVVVGVDLIVGALVGIAAFFGTLIHFNFQLAGSASTNPVLFALGVLLVLAWKVAGYWGVDRFLLTRFGIAWSRGPHAQTTAVVDRHLNRQSSPNLQSDMRNCGRPDRLSGASAIANLHIANSPSTLNGMSTWRCSSGDKLHIGDHAMYEQSTTPPRHHALLIAAYEAALSIASEVDLPTVLQRLVDLARQVTPARYAALGVTDENGTIVEFITSGMTWEERLAIGPIPRGHGMLGELIQSRNLLLVPDIAADARSVGFPEHHPPMRTLIGVPILHADRVLGNLYLTERLDDQPFDDHNLEVLQLLAAHAATAIDRAHLYQQLADARRRAEEQRDHLRTILDNLPAGVWIQTVPDGTIELANTTAIEMLSGPNSPTGVLPVPERDFRLLQIDGAPLPQQQRPAERAIRGENVRNRQLVLENWEGQQAPVLVQTSPLRDTNGEVTRVVVVIQDVTRLRAAEQLKDDFLSLISHEFRTPLTAIHGGAHLLGNQLAGLDQMTRQELLTDIVLESDRLDRMLTNMLSLTAIQAGRLEPTTEPVLVEPLARRVAGEVKAESRGHRILIDLAPGLPPVEADPDQLAQVLRNLYENAIKYSPRGGEIRVSGHRQGEQVAIQISDTGVGIAAEHVPHVFERFRRPGADPTVRGMGLGLYLSRSLIQAQGGEISADSAGVGLGATFSVSLPIAEGWELELGDVARPDQ